MPSRQVILLLIGTAWLTACSNRLNTSEVESAIKSDIERQGRRLTLKEVRCPSDVSRQPNGFFRCVGELKPEGTFTINVVQVDNKGTVEWDVPNSKVMLNLVKVENQIQDDLTKATNKQALIDCGSDVYRANQTGDRFECQIVGGMTVGTDKIETVLVSIASDGNLTWQEIRQPIQPVAALANPAQASLEGATPVQATSAAPAAGSSRIEAKAAKPDTKGSSK
ncbi:MAG TPA: hypothetical protein V6D29_22440 [Leptolyngbyaceae cyanobacterium]